MASEWRKMTVLQLKAELKKLGLDDTGRKSHLIERLSKHVSKEVKEVPKPAAVTKSIFDEPLESESDSDVEHNVTVSDDNKSESVCEKAATVKEEPEPSAEKEKSKLITEKDHPDEKPESPVKNEKPSPVTGNKAQHMKVSTTPDANESKDKPDANTDVKPAKLDPVSQDAGATAKESSPSDVKQEVKQEMETEEASDSKQRVTETETKDNPDSKQNTKEIDVKTEDAVDVESEEKKTNEGETDTTKKATSDAKTNGQPKKWIDIMDCSNNDKVLEELEKIGKVEAFKNRQKEHDQVGKLHKIRIFPLTIQDMATSFIQDIATKAKICVVKYGVVEKQEDKLGWLMAVFRTRAEVKEVVADIKKAREDLKVYYESGDKTEKGNSWHVEWAKFVSKPDPGDVNIYRLFVPSLPQTITEEDMWDIFPTARDIILVDAKPRKHAYVHFWNEKSGRAALDELNAQGPPREDLQFCRLLPQGELHKLIMATSSGTDKNVTTKGPETTLPSKHNVDNTRSQFKPQHRTFIEGKGKPKNLMNIHLRQPVGSARRQHKQRDFRSERPSYNPSSFGEGDHLRGPLENPFAEMQSQNLDMGPEVIDTLQTLLSQVNQPEARHRPPPRGPRNMMESQPAPKPLMETFADTPPQDQTSLPSGRGRDRKSFGKMKRPHSPVPSYAGGKRPRDRYVSRGSHSVSPRGKGQRGFVSSGRMSDDFDRPSGMREDYGSRGGMRDDYRCPASESDEYGGFREFGGRGNRGNRSSYGMGRPYNSSYGDERGGSFQRGNPYDDAEDDYQKYQSPAVDQYGGPDSSFGASAEPFNSPRWSQPDQDYRAPEMRMNRSMGSTNTFSKFTPLNDSLPMDQPRFPVGEGRNHRTGPYY